MQGVIHTTTLLSGAGVPGVKGPSEMLENKRDQGTGDLRIQVKGEE